MKDLNAPTKVFVLLLKTFVWSVFLCSCTDRLSEVVTRLNDRDQLEVTSPFLPAQENLEILNHKELREVRTRAKGSRVEKAKVVSQHVAKLNEELLAKLSPASIPSTNAPLHVQAIYAALAQNQVAKISANDRYDLRGDIGFCFGRAAFVHYMLLEKGAAQSSIAKIFALGRITTGNQFWTFHMATMWKAPPDHNWWVVDSIFEKPLLVREWTQRVQNLDFNKKAPQIRFYVSDPRKFQPNYGAYTVQDFHIPELKRYFSELFSRP